MNKLRGANVYIAGPVEAIPDGGADWRNEITSPLNNIGINVWNPLVKPYWYIREFGNEYGATQQTADKQMLKRAIDDNTDMNETNIVKRLALLRRVCLRLSCACDFIICKVGGPTVGTFEELAAAANCDKPILFFGELDSSWRYHQFIQHDKFWFKNINEIIEYLKEVNNNSIQVDPIKWIFLNDNWPSGINHEDEQRHP